jgi:hypothetical protein
MRNRFRSFEEAKRRFDELAAIEPRLAPLWLMCRCAAPGPANDEVADAFDVDAYDIDPVASEDTWCAESWFLATIKPAFGSLVGWDRTEEDELRTARAYDDVYAALLFHALDLTCACCRHRAQRRSA